MLICFYHSLVEYRSLLALLIDPTVVVYWRFRQRTGPAAASLPHIGLLAFRFDALRVAIFLLGLPQFED